MLLTTELPVELEHKIEDTAASLGRTGAELFMLLILMLSYPDMKKSGDRVTQDLADELLLYFQRTSQDMLQANGKTLDMLPDYSQIAMSSSSEDTPTMEKRIAALKNTPVPQTLADLQPRRLPPSGKTAMEMIQGQWPGDETVDELLEQLEALG